MRFLLNLATSGDWVVCSLFNLARSFANIPLFRIQMFKLGFLTRIKQHNRVCHVRILTKQPLRMIAIAHICYFVCCGYKCMSFLLSRKWRTSVYSKTCTCESCVVRNPDVLSLIYSWRNERFKGWSMNEPRHYPPPDFSCPPPDFIQPFQQQQQQQPGSSSFHPSMWSWGETPEPTWESRGQAEWHTGAGFGPPSGRGDYGSKRPHGE